MIAVDWGTTNFRAYRIDQDGTIVARSSSSQGILRVEHGKFEEALRSDVATWLAEGETRILVCGMAGSRQGWVETKYLPCPAGISDLARAAVPIPFAGAEVRLIPGVQTADTSGVPEVMRGEETSAMGILGAFSGEGLVCFPGTHSKWLQISSDKIVSFTTHMTGETYSALRTATILGRTMTSNDGIDPAAFQQGVARSVDTGGLLHHLFGVRTLVLMDQLHEDSSASYLSGLLIGHEVRAAMPGGSQVHLVGAAALCDLYAQAIAICGGSAKIEHKDAAALGLAAIARRVQWT